MNHQISVTVGPTGSVTTALPLPEAIIPSAGSLTRKGENPTVKWLGMTIESHGRRQGSARLKVVTLENVWRTLECGEWMSRVALEEACGTDDTVLTRIISFLARWEFVDVKSSPELVVRRKPGIISPLETFEALRTFADQQLGGCARGRIAERVACRICSSRELTFVGPNEVECNRCHERQWYAIEPCGERKREARSSSRLGFVDRVRVRFGLLQGNQGDIA